ncbi:Subtilase family protein [Muriicola jejuensis]|uniref:S8 family serine peptidase n=1 Tax=Muriicola jejuensis TaxID=504488 RepID=A0A6P0UA99_9FLAO|nr:S8 family peptidase [Muriicola jejuensis]NER09957.1 S8 family serine peptidase [Muriicola jejuensis]SMP04429.1 Subtilase family protein [Muriicola jejuensis]
MIRNLKLKSLLWSAGFAMMGCGSINIVSTPIENIDAVPLKIAPLTEAEKESWGHADLLTDTIPGMSVDKAYDEIIGKKKGEKVVVAVLDSGIDLNHEDLDEVIWTNKGEKPGNGVDDDGNGYVDDVHGYNFLGEAYNEQLEYARILRLNLGDEALRATARKKLDEELKEARETREILLSNKQQTEQILGIVKQSHEAVSEELGKANYSKEEVAGIDTTDSGLQRSVSVIQQMFNYGDNIPEVIVLIEEDIERASEGVDYFNERIDYHFNVDFDGRKAVGDDPYNFNDRIYGNGNPVNRVEDESHGTHVAGIIAAERNNGLGVNGVANNVEIMSIRAVPNGDEYDKDIALGIRYAVDNGAKIINASFGKAFSPNAEWVYDAIKYAADKDVLIVHAAGNDALDLDDKKNTNYPNDHMIGETEFADNVITVGALNNTYGSEMVASFSNYGKQNVDLFAPGGSIYSTMPGGKYEFQGGTSMAAPAVSGIAALIRSYFPNLTASEVKHILMDSGLSTKMSVVVGGDPEKAKPFDQLSRTGKIANAYNALIMAQKVSDSKSK